MHTADPTIVSTAERLLPAWPDPATRLSRVYVYQGELTRRASDRAAAEGWRLAAAHRDSDDPALWNELGDAEAKNGDNAAAVAHYRRALQLDPWSIRALNGLGRLAAAQGDTPAAKEFFRRSLSVLADQPDITARLRTL